MAATSDIEKYAAIMKEIKLRAEVTAVRSISE
jgi:hypothetical protein